MFRNLDIFGMYKREWIAFFSQTGAEICDISERIGRWPDRIVTNLSQEEKGKIDKRMPVNLIYFTNNRKPLYEEYLSLLAFAVDPIITLHGWLRIVPEELCGKYEIYNGHPGLITKYPELKGKDPQIRAFEGGYEEAGCVLHRVVAAVDEGPILFSKSFLVEKLSLDELFLKFRESSLNLWIKFFMENNIC